MKNKTRVLMCKYSLYDREWEVRWKDTNKVLFYESIIIELIDYIEERYGHIIGCTRSDKDFDIEVEPYE